MFICETQKLKERILEEMDLVRQEEEHAAKSNDYARALQLEYRIRGLSDVLVIASELSYDKP